jgi:hypothetical protein
MFLPTNRVSRRSGADARWRATLTPLISTPIILMASTSLGAGTDC